MSHGLPLAPILIESPKIRLPPCSNLVSQVQLVHGHSALNFLFFKNKQKNCVRIFYPLLIVFRPAEKYARGERKRQKKRKESLSIAFQNMLKRQSRDYLTDFYISLESLHNLIGG